jgi:3-oxoacyl-[acyl-carrier-protein] synthase II
MSRRVVITGLGAVTGLGVGVGPLWEALLAGRSALRRISRFDPSGFPCRLAAEAKDFSAKDYVPKSYRKAVKVMARDIELAVGAAKVAVEDAGLVTRAGLPEGSTDPTTYPSARMGCHIGAGLIAADTEELAAALATSRREDGWEHAGGFSLKAWGAGDNGGGAMNNLTPLWLLKYLPNMLACHVTIIHGAEGPSNTITCAEASGLLSIGESTRVIQRDDADLCFSGGAESKVNLMGLLRLDLAGRLAATGDEQDGSRIVRPYDSEAPGGVVGEGGGILVLEEHGAASRRGARVYAEVAGFGSAQSGPPCVPPLRESPPGTIDEGVQFAIEAALDDAGTNPSEIDAIVPHGSGVRSTDVGEAAALRAVFGPRLSEIPLVTLTPSIGGCMAGMGAVQAAVGAMCLKEQKLPARLHAGRAPAGMQAGPSESRPARLRHVLVATGSMGGQNAAIILKGVA